MLKLKDSRTGLMLKLAEHRVQAEIASASHLSHAIDLAVEGVTV